MRVTTTMSPTIDPYWLEAFLSPESGQVAELCLIGCASSTGSYRAFGRLAASTQISATTARAAAV